MTGTRWTEQDLERLNQRSGRTAAAAAAAAAAGLPRASTNGHQAGLGKRMNKTEAAYAQLLDLRRAAGEIRWYGFEAMKLYLARRGYYSPDFVVLGVGGEIEFHEVKGRKGKRYWAREDSKLKIKFAARIYDQFRFKIVWQSGAGGWDEEVF